jgi:hypothetical protein
MSGAWFTLKEASSILRISFIPLSDGTQEQKIQYKHQGFSRFCYIVLYLMCTLFSVLTTANMAFNAMGRNSTYEMTNSIAFKNQQTAKDLAASIVQTNMTNISSLIKEKELAVSRQISQVDKWKSTRVSDRQKEINRANSIATEYDSKIEALRKSNADMQNQITSPIITDANSTISIMNMFSGVNTQYLILIVVIILGVVVDLLGAFFTIQFSKEIYHKYNFHKPRLEIPQNESPLKAEGNNSNKKTYKFTKKHPLQPIAAKTKEPAIIGFKTDVKPENDNSLKAENNMIDENIKAAYITYMNKTAKNGVSKGYAEIGKRIGVKIETARAIRNQLETEGIVVTKGNRTVIL